jgi:hypothetical protein
MSTKKLDTYSIYTFLTFSRLLSFPVFHDIYAFTVLPLVPSCTHSTTLSSPCKNVKKLIILNMAWLV